MFERTVYSKLVKWKNKSQRLPLIVRGARQVGKTSLIVEFGKSFRQCHVFNFQKTLKLRECFKKTNDPGQILKFLEVVTEKKIDPKKDLIFFDEIQDCPEALNSLKFISEDHPDWHVIAAGSLLGIYLSSHSFPVGKVHFLNMYPLSFSEFLKAKGRNQLAELLELLDPKNNIYHEELEAELRLYLSVGGLPKVISEYLENEDLNEARLIQDELLLTYRGDFAKYAGPADAIKILKLFENIPAQLAKENHRFQFNLLGQGARYAQFQTSVDWLISAGLCLRLPIIENAEIPLKPWVKENHFKLYFFDVGLLGALSDLPMGAFMTETNLFKTFKGAFIENYFYQEFRSSRKEELYCWVGRNSEVDFLYTDEKMNLVPIEVKSGSSGKLKSLQVFSEKYDVKIKTRCSAQKLEIRKDNHFRNIPLMYASLV